jgi:hypothetical protein
MIVIGESINELSATELNEAVGSDFTRPNAGVGAALRTLEAIFPVRDPEPAQHQ